MSPNPPALRQQLVRRAFGTRNARQLNPGSSANLLAFILPVVR